MKTSTSAKKKEYFYLKTPAPGGFVFLSLWYHMEVVWSPKVLILQTLKKAKAFHISI